MHTWYSAGSERRLYGTGLTQRRDWESTLQGSNFTIWHAGVSPGFAVADFPQFITMTPNATANAISRTVAIRGERPFLERENAPLFMSMTEAKRLLNLSANKEVKKQEKPKAMPSP